MTRLALRKVRLLAFSVCVFVVVFLSVLVAGYFPVVCMCVCACLSLCVVHGCSSRGEGVEEREKSTEDEVIPSPSLHNSSLNIRADLTGHFSTILNSCIANHIPCLL